MSKGKLNLIMGPMFSGKTTELLRRYKRYIIANKKCLLIKFNEDNRYSRGKIVTHDNNKGNDAYSCSKLEEVNSIVSDYDVICVDEIQFFNNAPEICDQWANQGKIVEVCGLNGDYNKKPFDSISKIIPKVDDITYLRAIDKHSGEEAPFTVRLINSNEQIIIGGKNIYDVMDRNNYNIFMSGKNEVM